MKPILHWLLAGLILWGVTGCDELIVKDISNRQIEVLTPSPDAVLSDGAIRFSWEKLDYADYYRLILVSRSLSDMGATIADTLLDGNTFVPLESLISGTYEWRLQAYNSEYQTRAQAYNFRIQMHKDIRAETVTLLSPQDNAELESGAVVLSWEPLAGADSYRLVVASPGFGNAQQVLADSTLTGTFCRITLPDGDYQWRLDGRNEEFTSLPVTASFRVRSIADLSDKTVEVVSPKSGHVLTSNNVLFSWDAIAGAEEYRITVVSPDFSNIQQLLEDTSTAETNFRITLPDGNYQWRVQAQNSKSTSKLQTHSFQVSLLKDISGKQISVIAPSDGIETTNPDVLFAWEPVSGATSYRLMIASPSFAQVVSLVEDKTLDETSYRTTLPTGTYQWRIQALNEKYQTAPQTYGLKIIP